MSLSAEQIRQFEEEGHLFLPDLFSPREVALLKSAIPAVTARPGPEVVRERNSDAVRLVYGAHVFDPVFRRLGRHPRLIRTAEALLGNRVYCHQSRLNPKAPFDGEIWTWHQDFATWHHADGLLQPKAMMVAVFLEESTPVNGPFLFIPRSHRHGMVHDAEEDREARGYVLYNISHDTIARLAEEGGIVARTATPGSVLFCHCNIVHGSSANISPYPRTIFYMNLATVDNPATKFDRLPHHCSRDFSPIEPLEDDCLLEADMEGVPAE